MGQTEILKEVISPAESDLTRKYTSKKKSVQTVGDFGNNDISKLVSSLDSINKSSKEIESLYSKIREDASGKSDSFKERFYQFLSKIKIVKPRKEREVSELFEEALTSIENKAQVIFDEIESCKHYREELNSHIDNLLDDMEKSKDAYLLIRKDSEFLSQEASKLEGVIKEGDQNELNITKLKEQRKFRLIEIAQRNANNEAMACIKSIELKKQSYEVCNFYFNLVDIFVSRGKLAYDDITEVVGELRTIINVSVPAKTLMESMSSAEKNITWLSSYMQKFTGIFGKQMNYVSSARLNRGSLFGNMSIKEIQRNLDTTLGGVEKQNDDYLKRYDSIFNNEKK